MPQETQEITGRMVEDVMPLMLRTLRDCEVALGSPPEPQSADALAGLRQRLWGLVKASAPIIQQIGDTVVYYRRYERLVTLQHELEMAQEKLASLPSPLAEPLPGQEIPVADSGQPLFPPRRSPILSDNKHARHCFEQMQSSRLESQQDTLNRLAEDTIDAVKEG